MIRRHIHRAYHIVRPFAPQFVRYLLSGGSAAFLELASYQILLLLDIHYATAAPISGLVGFVSAFLFHKFFVFQKREKTTKQAVRYVVLQTWNLFAQWAIVVILVEFFAVHEVLAKILGIGTAVMWNFILYKFFVYA